MYFRQESRRFSAAAVLVLLVLAAGCDKPQAPSATEPAAEPAAPAENGGAAPAARARETAPDRPVDAETLPYAEVAQELVYGYFAFPSDMIEPLPAVIVIHDWWGLDEQVRTASARLAAEGYIVLAVDLYGGATVDDASSARARMIRVLENPDAVRENFAQALDFVRVAGAPSIATLGWGLGGTWSLNAALAFPDEIEAAVVYYGQVLTDERRLAALEAPLLGLFGARDRAVPVDGVRAFDDTLSRLGKPHEIRIYDRVGHRFADPRGAAFDAAVAADARRRVAAFLDETLTADAEE